MTIRVSHSAVPPPSCPGAPAYVQDGYGVLDIDKSGSGGFTYLNGVSIGYGTTKGLIPGRYKVSFRRNGYTPEDVDIEISPFRITSVVWEPKFYGSWTPTAGVIKDPNNPSFWVNYEGGDPMGTAEPSPIDEKMGPGIGGLCFGYYNTGFGIWIDDKFYQECQIPCDFTFHGLQAGFHVVKFVASDDQSLVSEWPVIVLPGQVVNTYGRLPVTGIHFDGQTGAYTYTPLAAPLFQVTQMNQPCSGWAYDTIKSALYYGICHPPPQFYGASGSYNEYASGTSATWSVSPPPVALQTAYAAYLNRQCARHSAVAIPIGQTVLETPPDPMVYCTPGYKRCYGQQLQTCPSTGLVGQVTKGTWSDYCDYENWWNHPDELRYPRAVDDSAISIWFDPNTVKKLTYAEAYGQSASSTYEAPAIGTDAQATTVPIDVKVPGGTEVVESQYLVSNVATATNILPTSSVPQNTSQYITPSTSTGTSVVYQQDAATAAALATAQQNQAQLQSQLSQLTSTIAQLQSSSQSAYSSNNTALAQQYQSQLAASQASMSQLQSQIAAQNATIQQLQTQATAQAAQQQYVPPTTTTTGGFSSMLDDVSQQTGLSKNTLLIGGAAALGLVVILMLRKK